MTRTLTAAACAMVIVASQGARISAQARPARAAQAKPAPTPAMTLTGCLRADGAKFVLSDLPGDQTPKGRSWKTGYILKTAKDVEVTAASTSVKLKDHVGHKIAVTGVRGGDPTHFTARTIKHVAASCS